MKVSNVRLGFACNSSSTHSLVLLPAGVDLNISCSYRLDTPEEKLMYMVYNYNLQDNPPVLEALGIDIDKLFAPEIDTDWGYVPCNYNSSEINIEYLKELAKYLHNPNIMAIEYEDYQELDESIKQLDFCNGSSTIARKDKEYWALFNRDNGTKVRMTFNDSAPNYVKSTCPELVDIKVTDYCPYGCPACYQGSTAKGMHASLKYLDQLSSELSKQEVFEVALGGGEPTLHPKFKTILKMFHDKGITANFTTRNFQYVLNNPDLQNYTSAIALSIDDPNIFLSDIVQSIFKMEDNRIKLNVQTTLGVVTREDFKAIARTLSGNTYNLGWKRHPGLTLLGYKTTGRGADVDPEDYSWWMHDLIESDLYEVGIDTVLAQQYREDLKEIPSPLITFEEGKFSCYVDAVAQTINSSSYDTNPGQNLSEVEALMSHYEKF